MKDNDIALNYVVPGGLVGILTEMDKQSNFNNDFIGRFLGIPGKMPESYTKILVKYRMFRCFEKNIDHRLDSQQTDWNTIIVTINSANVTGFIKKMNKKYLLIILNDQTCILRDQKIVISRKIKDNWSLMAWGEFIRGG
mmetsp:Transcript_12958/g.26469  ORF Transcript_12958/g.26469 Transcript_12958/m.26469 type:complete len:139 (+) Transcript_12958:171-587(+)